MKHSDHQDGVAQKQAWPWWLLAAATAVWLLWMTLRPNSAVTRDLWPLVRTTNAFGIPLYLAVDLAGNIVVFAPLGATLALAMKYRAWPIRVALATLLGAALSLGIELAQTRVPSRIPGVEDWLLNTVGATFGALIACLLQKMVRRTRSGTPADNNHPGRL